MDPEEKHYVGFICMSYPNSSELETGGNDFSRLPSLDPRIIRTS